MTRNITGMDLLAWGYKPGKHFGLMLAEAQSMATTGATIEQIKAHVAGFAPPEPPPLDPALQFRTNSRPIGTFLAPETAEEVENFNGVVRHMDALMRVPTLSAGAIMPDACPSGSAEGTIPVGGVVASTDIHPGMHSADICCSMAVSVFKRDMDVSHVLDIAQKLTHFGTGLSARDAGANAQELAPIVGDAFDTNPFLKDLGNIAVGQLGTQGDGNHFLYVGHMKSTGQLALVTHHGSRNLGGQLYKRGMAAAKRHTAIVSPRTPEHNAWIKADSQEGVNYWNALDLTRRWTHLNHFTIHDAIQQALGNKVVDRFWNEHNFVFQRADGLFYHAKGATPMFGHSSMPHLIPLNMGQPILVVTPHLAAPVEALGFAPHGAGRNLSRTSHLKKLEAEFGCDRRGLSPRDIETIVKRETAGIDARFYCGVPDISELPSAYKNPDQVRAAIERHNLARIVDEVIPGGSLMAGEAPWFRGKKPKKVTIEGTPWTDKGFQTGL